MMALWETMVLGARRKQDCICRTYHFALLPACLKMEIMK
jgi:hypothetical protein